jgi:hypothetical protein
MKITKRQIRKIIREELIREAEEGALSNAEFAKTLKTDAPKIAGAVPTKLNDEMVSMIKSLAAMAQFDKSKFEKLGGLIDKASVKALEKAAKGEKPAEKTPKEG